MPRKRRPVSQPASQPGKAYPNRSDLTAPATPTGMPYGQRQQLEQAQKQVPQAAAPQGPPPQNQPQGGVSGPAPGGPPQAGGGEPDLAALLGAAKGTPFPSQRLTDPTARPDEQITAGLGQMPGGAVDTLTPMLEEIYRMYPTDELADLLDWALRKGMS